MTTITATAFRKNLFGYLSDAVRYNTPVRITTKEGGAVVISEQDYNAMQETLYLLSIPGMGKSIVAGMATAVTDCADWEDMNL